MGIGTGRFAVRTLAATTGHAMPGVAIHTTPGLKRADGALQPVLGPSQREHANAHAASANADMGLPPRPRLCLSHSRARSPRTQTALRQAASPENPQVSYVLTAIKTGHKEGMTTKLVNFHADRDLVVAAQAKAKEKGKSLTWVLVQALTLYTQGKWHPTDPQSNRLDGLEERVEALEAELRQLQQAARGY